MADSPSDIEQRIVDERAEMAETIEALKQHLDFPARMIDYRNSLVSKAATTAFAEIWRLSELASSASEAALSRLRAVFTTAAERWERGPSSLERYWQLPLVVVTIATAWRWSVIRKRKS